MAQADERNSGAESMSEEFGHFASIANHPGITHCQSMRAALDLAVSVLNFGGR